MLAALMLITRTMQVNRKLQLVKKAKTFTRPSRYILVPNKQIQNTNEMHLNSLSPEPKPLFGKDYSPLVNSYFV